MFPTSYEDGVPFNVPVVLSKFIQDIYVDGLNENNIGKFSILLIKGVNVKNSSFIIF